MPLYEYLCDNCNTKFEQRRAMREIDAPTSCPQCQSDHVARQISLIVAFTHSNGGVNAVGGGGGCACGGACSCQSHN